MDILRIAARVAQITDPAGTPGMALPPVQVSVTRPSGMSLEQAVEELRPEMGVETGAYEVVDPDQEFEPGRVNTVLLWEMDDSMMGRSAMRTVSADGKVELEIEWP